MGLQSHGPLDVEDGEDYPVHHQGPQHHHQLQQEPAEAVGSQQVVEVVVGEQGEEEGEEGEQHPLAHNPVWGGLEQGVLGSDEVGDLKQVVDLWFYDLRKKNNPM